MTPAAHPSRASIYLRPVEPADVPVLFEQQNDPEANELAGTKPRTKEVFLALWEKIFADQAVVPRVIICDGELVGGISCFQADGLDAVGYWIAREHWGKGIAGRALELFLAEFKRRPLHATAARANTASIRILEKCGFRCTGHHIGEETDRYVACEVASFVLD